MDKCDKIGIIILCAAFIAIGVSVYQGLIEKEMRDNELNNLLETADCDELLTMIQEENPYHDATKFHKKWITDKCWKV